MADEWDKYITKEQTQGTDEWSQYATKTTTQPNESKLASIGAGALGLGAVGVPLVGAGALAKGAMDYWKRPQKLLAPIESELTGVARATQLPTGVRYQDLPKLIGSRMAEQRMQIKDFDDMTLATSSEELASSVKTAMPRLKQSNYETYGKMLEEGEQLISSSGKSLNTQQVGKLMGDIRQLAIEGGATEESVAHLAKLEDSLAPQKVSLKRNMTLQQVKKTIDNAIKNSDTDTKALIRSRWGQFIEENAPSDVSKNLASANAKYKDFLEQNKALRKLTDPATGDYDYDKLFKYIFQRAKTRINSDFKKLMGGLAKIEPEVGAKTKDLLAARTKKIDMQRTLNSLRTWLNKAEELVSKRGALLEKFPKRLGGGLGKTVGDIGRSVGRAMIFKGISAYGMGRLSDPFNAGGALMDLIGGKKTSPEEFKKFLEEDPA